MKFEKNKNIEDFGKKLGYLIAYIIFTTVLYLIITIIYNKNLNYLIVMLITLFIVLVGTLLKRYLK